VADDAVPPAIEEAAALLAALSVAGTELQPVLERGGQIKRDRTGPLETEWFEGAPVEDQILEALDAVSGLLRRSDYELPRITYDTSTPADPFEKGAFDNPGAATSGDA